MSYTIDILLATYNGERFLREQIDSILSQDYKFWRLLIRDDGSHDATLSIINEYQVLYPTKIFLLDDDEDHLGVVRCFSKLMQSSESQYVALCDQDDVWLPEKLKDQIDIMLKKELELTALCPLLLHSDLQVIDQHKNVMADSFWNFQNYRPTLMNALNRLLIQNYVTGCTVLANRALIDISIPVPNEVVMHDWWLELVATCNGAVFHMNKPTVLYRQHEDNDTGAKKWGLQYILQMIAGGRDNMQKQLLKTYRQAQALLLLASLSDVNKETVAIYVKLYESGWMRKRIMILRNRFFKNGFVRNVAVFMSI